MITCCEIALCLAITNIVSLAIFAGYTLKVSRRTLKLEKKNGHDLDRIAKLEARDEQIEELKKEVRELKKSKNE